MKRNVSIVDFVTDPQLLGLGISKPQESLLRSIYGLSLTRSMLDNWQQCTGRKTYPRHGFSEATIICGARSERIAGLQRQLLPSKLPWAITSSTSPKANEL